ncbi:MAG: hypothetical protein GY811_11705 [Myxococcales bacterium]|nr:hypothetical protein [Myxococcales bacterium]
MQAEIAEHEHQRQKRSRTQVFLHYCLHVDSLLVAATQPDRHRGIVLGWVRFGDERLHVFRKLLSEIEVGRELGRFDKEHKALAIGTCEICIRRLVVGASEFFVAFANVIGFQRRRPLLF